MMTTLLSLIMEAAPSASLALSIISLIIVIMAIVVSVLVAWVGLGICRKEEVDALSCCLVAPCVRCVYGEKPTQSAAREKEMEMDEMSGAKEYDDGVAPYMKDGDKEEEISKEEDMEKELEELNNMGSKKLMLNLKTLLSSERSNQGFLAKALQFLKHLKKEEAEEEDEAVRGLLSRGTSVSQRREKEVDSDDEYNNDDDDNYDGDDEDEDE